MSKSNTVYQELVRRINNGLYRPGKRFLLLIGGSTEQLGIVQQYISSLLRQNLANAGH